MDGSMEREAEEYRTERVSVMVTPEMRDWLDRRARKARSRRTVSPAAYEILADFFAEDVHERGQKQTACVNDSETPRQTA